MKKQKTTLGRKKNSKKNMFILLARDSRAVNLFVYYSASVCSDLAPRRIKVDSSHGVRSGLLVRVCREIKTISTRIRFSHHLAVAARTSCAVVSCAVG